MRTRIIIDPLPPSGYSKPVQRIKRWRKQNARYFTRKRREHKRYEREAQSESARKHWLHTRICTRHWKNVAKAKRKRPCAREYAS